MGVRFNHTIVMNRDAHQAALLLAEILRLPDPSQLGSMLMVHCDGSAAHPAFLLCEGEYDQVLRHIREHRLPSWPGPGGQGLCFADPDGHPIQIIATPPRSGVPFSA